MSETQADAGISIPGIYHGPAADRVESPPPAPHPAVLRVPPPPPPVVQQTVKMPANELSVGCWLSDSPQWVQDEQGSRCALAISRRELFVGDPSMRGEARLSVAGTVRAAGLVVHGTGPGGDGPIELLGLPHVGQAPEAAALRSVLIDPGTGQLYWK